MCGAEFANRSEHSSTVQYKMAMKHDVCSISDPPPREEVSRTGLSAWDEHLPKVEASKSETSFGSEESSVLEETFMSRAFPGLEEAPNLEFSSMPEVGAKSRYFLGEDVSPEPLLGEEPFHQEEEPQTMSLELLPGLRDPFAEVEAKLARLSCTVAGADVPQADIPEVPTQVAVVMQKFNGQSSAGGRGAVGCSQVSNLCGSSTTFATATVLWLRGQLRALGFRGLGKSSSV